MIKEALQGRFLRHPLHPLLTHFPVGLFSLSLLLDLASFIWPDATLVRASFYCIVAGLVMALLAALPGIVDYTDIRRDHPARKIATTHMLLNLVAVALYAVNAGVRAGAETAGHVPALPFVLSLAAYGLLTISAYLGGKLIYTNGIGVGRHRRNTSLPEQTLCLWSDALDPAQIKEEQGIRYLPVAPKERVPEDHTLRVNIDGTVIALVNLRGEFFAFQEFCTHRYGPLSEGAFHGHEVECPWHRSCFDVRTGKVTKGPAKVDLRTFPVQLHGGTIYVGMSPKSEPVTE
jgi:nitrite reductase/ring-hydroxylating ferredoxin subunit/uncharacterized membrane protein